MFGVQVQRQARSIAEQIVRPIAALGLSPNVVSLIGLALNAAAGAEIAFGPLRWGGVLILLASIFDLFDGAVARVQHTASVFGSFLDSTLDRYAEGMLLLGIVIHVSRTQVLTTVHMWEIILAYSAAMLSLIVSYTRARAEGLGLDCKVGLMERPERVLLLGAGLLIGGDTWLVWTLGLLTVTTGFTGIQRILHVQRVAAEKR